MSIRRAAKLCDIPYENAKLINRIHKSEGRLHRLKRIITKDEEKQPLTEAPKPPKTPRSACSSLDSKASFAVCDAFKMSSPQNGLICSSPLAKSAPFQAAETALNGQMAYVYSSSTQVSDPVVVKPLDSTLAPQNELATT